jgi:hypothetical protein
MTCTFGCIREGSLMGIGIGIGTLILIIVLVVLLT